MRDFTPSNARTVLNARAQGDPRFVAFIVLMQARTGMDPSAIVAKIEEMAERKEEEPCAT